MHIPITTVIDSCLELLEKHHHHKTKPSRAEVDNLFEMVHRLCEISVYGVYKINYDLYDVIFNEKNKENGYKEIADKIRLFCKDHKIKIHEILASKASRKLRNITSR